MPKLNLTNIGVVVAILAVAVPASWASISWQWEHHEQVASNTTYILLQRFERLSAIRKARKLTPREWHTWCIIGQKLGYWQRCPAR